MSMQEAKNLAGYWCVGSRDHCVSFALDTLWILRRAVSISSCALRGEMGVAGRDLQLAATTPCECRVSVDAGMVG